MNTSNEWEKIEYFIGYENTESELEYLWDILVKVGRNRTKDRKTLWT